MTPPGQCDTASIKPSNHLGPFTRLELIAANTGISATERCQACGKTVVRRIKTALQIFRAQKLLPPLPGGPSPNTPHQP